jgi:hypothetical protein
LRSLRGRFSLGDRVRSGETAWCALPSQQFVACLQMLGVVPSPCSKPSPSEVLIRRCVDYLRDSRGLCLRSIEAYLPFVRASVAAQQLPERMSGVDGLAVRNHVLDAWRGRSISFVRLLTAALLPRRHDSADLWTAVPPLRRWRHAPVPALLTAEGMERVIAMTFARRHAGAVPSPSFYSWPDSASERARSSRSSSTTSAGTQARSWRAASVAAQAG